MWASVKQLNASGAEISRDETAMVSVLIYRLYVSDSH